MCPMVDCKAIVLDINKMYIIPIYSNTQDSNNYQFSNPTREEYGVLSVHDAFFRFALLSDKSYSLFCSQFSWPKRFAK